MSAATCQSVPRDAAVRIVRELRDRGHVAYLAGGCVRDELLGLCPKDYDVATDATPDRVRSIFRRAKAVGEHFGVVVVALMGQRVEVATFRTEWGYTDKRRPDRVEFSDAEHDARRRDFTINGLFLDPIGGEVIDYVGGQADLKAGIVRAIGDPAERLDEDHLRALRAVRFAARYGFTIEPATREAIRRDALELKGVSRERIGQEVRLMLAHPSRARAAADLQDLGLDEPVLNEANAPVPLPVLGALDVDADYPTALAAWAIDRGEPREAVVVPRWRRALILTNDETDALRATLRDWREIRESWSGLRVARQKRLAGAARFAQVLHLLSASDPSLAADVRHRVDRLSQTPSGIAPAPLITGDDLVRWGFTPGPNFKNWLDHAYDAQLEDRIDSPEQARRLILELARASSHP